MNLSPDSVWAFGGPLADAAPATAWTVLAVLAGVSVVFSWISYRTSVARLGVGPSTLLTLLRAAFLLTLLACLANPVRVQRTTGRAPAPPPPPAPPRLTVVVDRSDSMTLADNRGRSRLDDALATWRRLEKSTQGHFGQTQYFSFAADLRPAATLDEAATRTGGTNETKLYQSVSSLLKKPPGEPPDALVVLTDGVDTSTDSATLLRESAVAAGVPVYFVAGSNRSARPDPFLRVREWRVPSTALQNTEFTIEASFEAFSRADRTVPFSLWQAGRRLMRGELALTTGSNLVARTFTVAVTDPGPVEFSLRLGAGDEAPVAARSMTLVRSARDKTMRVLVYQGVLDWGLRYLSSALRSDPSFQFVTIVTPESGLALTRASEPGGMMLGKLPETVAPLTQFDCIVLVHLFPQRLSRAQQESLVEFTRNGGSVFFLSPDKGAMPQYADSPLKVLLPVLLDGEAAGAVTGNDPRTATTTRLISTLPDDRERAKDRLLSFVLTDAGKASPIFAQAAGGGVLTPRFTEHVPLRRPKPGAEVLAIHPASQSAPADQQDILLAMQSYGRGRSGVLTTDALWRWKLDEPSTSRVVETFWQQLLLAMGQTSEKESLRFTNAPAQVRLGQATTLRLGGVSATDKLPVVMAKTPAGVARALPVKLTPGAEAPWSVEWSPDQAGHWELVAGVDGAFRASIFPSVVAEATGELAPSVPALDALRTLAGDTGGALLAQEAPAAWRSAAKKEKEPETVTAEHRVPEWNTWTVLGLALGLYAAELLLRRRWKLL
jgi:hypothetical protein